MENYEWRKNAAVVLRMYYCERIFLTSTAAATAFTLCNLFYVRKNYFAKTCAARILPTWKYWFLLNGLLIPLLLRPLTIPEMKQQWKKRVTMGKYLYTLYHLDEPEPVAEKAE